MGFGACEWLGAGCAVVNRVVSAGLAEKVTLEEGEGLEERSRQRDVKKHT